MSGNPVETFGRGVVRLSCLPKTARTVIAAALKQLSGNWQAEQEQQPFGTVQLCSTGAGDTEKLSLSIYQLPGDPDVFVGLEGRLTSVKIVRTAIEQALAAVTTLSQQPKTEPEIHY